MKRIERCAQFSKGNWSEFNKIDKKKKANLEANVKRIWNELEANLKQICEWRANLSRKLSTTLSKKSKIGQFDGIKKFKMKEQWVSFIQRQFDEKILFW